MRRLLREWEANLTIEFSELHTLGYQENEVFRPRFMHPQCFGNVLIHKDINVLLIGLRFSDADPPRLKNPHLRSLT